MNSATIHALRISRGIHRLANADVTIAGETYPCHHAGFDTTAPLHVQGRTKDLDVASTVVVPLFALDGTPYELERQIKPGVNIVEIRSRVRAALSHRVRLEHYTLDESSFSFVVTDDRR